MNRIRSLIRKAFTPVTIMLIPHSNHRPFNLKLPSIGIVLSVLLWAVGMVYVFSIGVNAVEYRHMKNKLDYYSGQFVEMRTTLAALKKAESEFRRLFSLGSKEKVLENVHPMDAGSIDMKALGDQVRHSVETVAEIREFLRQQKDVYLATPRGWPVSGDITSPYGSREHPVHGGEDFHSGVDISVPAGTPVSATADGVVSFSGWNGGSGNLVGLEHGLGYSTFYAHNRTNLVKVGQHVKRGDIVAYVGATGNATGPHTHYEIWKDGRHVNPQPFLEGRK
ncbi:MAG TPA: M23 family metallopeptidase [Thermodesulfovibrionales bacterium]|nr:M23 family metallopeptidase [Thermodesulfovibrionales bacterium]